MSDPDMATAQRMLDGAFNAIRAEDGRIFGGDGSNLTGPWHSSPFIIELLYRCGNDASQLKAMAERIHEHARTARMIFEHNQNPLTGTAHKRYSRPVVRISGCAIECSMEQRRGDELLPE